MIILTMYNTFDLLIPSRMEGRGTIICTTFIYNL